MTSIFVSQIKYNAKLLLSYLISDEHYSKLMYAKRQNKWPNLKPPKTFNEKILWSKLNHREDIHTQCADKLLVRSYVKEKIGEKYLVPIVMTALDPSEINLNDLPKQFIIKANHGSGWNHIVWDKDQIDFETIKKDCKNWLSQNYYIHTREWQYKNIKPTLLIEKLLIENGKIPRDFKIHCFKDRSGEVDFIIQVDVGRFEKHYQQFYNKNWEKQEFSIGCSAGDFSIEKPQELEQLLLLAEKLSEDFQYVRVDFYLLDNQIFFGELTFHHRSGCEVIKPTIYEQILGDKIYFKELSLP